ncbi:Ig-like domain-containing protein [Nocardioides rubriscoriae]|uniref:Ig-like domain-containing protein n=1 Tax=Nocardioides rubriscoriae TaxID=642762 RepID=UPI0011DFE61E|nr:hypothetical protein [Nocardioides rubriscoriae]
MTRRTTRRPTRAAVALTGAVVAALLATPAPAQAAPRAAADSFALYAGGTYTVDPIANDDTVLSLPPSSGPLSLCGVSGVDQQRVYVEQSGDSLVVEVSDTFQGTTRFSYEVCQGDQRDQGTVTLAVTRLQDLRAVKRKGTRGRVVFSNPNDVAVEVSWGSASSGRADASRTVPADRAITISTTRKSIYWVGLYSDQDVLVVVGDGVVTGLQRTR